MQFASSILYPTSAVQANIQQEQVTLDYSTMQNSTMIQWIMVFFAVIGFTVTAEYIIKFIVDTFKYNLFGSNSFYFSKNNKSSNQKVNLSKFSQTSQKNSQMQTKQIFQKFTQNPQKQQFIKHISNQSQETFYSTQPQYSNQQQQNPSLFQENEILSSDINDQKMRQQILIISKNSIQNNEIEQEMAKQIKIKLDEKYKPTWHVIVGKDFGSHITYEQNGFLYLYIDTYFIMIFKAE